MVCCRSREGAWIEIRTHVVNTAPPPSRSREGAWIEMLERHYWRTDTFVAPARERGLKYRGSKAQNRKGSRSREGAWIEIWIS